MISRQEQEIKIKKLQLELDNIKDNNKLRAIYCFKCKNIIYSRNSRDYVTCDCGNVSVHGIRIIFKDNAKFSEIFLDKLYFLDFILSMDYIFRNKNAHRFKDGYYSKFRIVKGSNIKFYSKLIVSEGSDALDDIRKVVVS